MQVGEHVFQALLIYYKVRQEEALTFPVH